MHTPIHGLKCAHTHTPTSMHERTHTHTPHARTHARTRTLITVQYTTVALQCVDSYCAYGTKTVVAYSAGWNPDNVSTALAATYSKQFDSRLVETINVGELRDQNRHPVVQEYMLDAFKDDSYAYTYDYMVAAQFDHNKVSDEVHAVALYNYEAYHTAPISLSLVDNTLLRHFVGAGYSIETQNDPIEPSYSKQVAEDVRTQNEIKLEYDVYHLNGRTYLTFAMPAIIVVTNFCVIYVIDERERGSKRLQLNSGVHPIVFWSATFLVDLLVLLVSDCAVMVAFVIADLESIIDTRSMYLVMVIFVFFAFAILPMTYVASLCISNGGIGISLLPMFSPTLGK